MKLPRVLCVDDEPRVLEALERTLSEDYELLTAAGAEAALALFDAGERFAVVISDMRMPGMDGAQLLAELRLRDSELVRVLLTGHADLEAAARAVNQGALFRFLLKPCPPETLGAALRDAVAEHRRKLTERDVLERTVTGVVRLLRELVDQCAPSVHLRSLAVRELVLHVVERLKLEPRWQFEAAAELHGIGYVALPQELVARGLSGAELAADEELTFASHVVIAERLLANVPRLEPVALAIALTQLEEEPAQVDPAAWLCSRLLRVAFELERLLSRGVAHREAVDQLRVRGGPLERRFLVPLLAFRHTAELTVVRSVRAAQLSSAMVLDDDARTVDGTLVVPAGRRLGALVVERLLAFARAGQLVEPLRVRAVD